MNKQKNKKKSYTKHHTVLTNVHALHTYMYTLADEGYLLTDKASTKLEGNVKLCMRNPPTRLLHQIHLNESLVAMMCLFSLWKFIVSWWVVIHHVKLPFSFRYLDPVVPKLGSGVKVVGISVGILAFCECGEVTGITGTLPQCVSARMVHSVRTTCPLRQWLQEAQLFTESLYVPWKSWGQKKATNQQSVRSCVMAFAKKRHCLAENYSANHILYQQEPLILNNSYLLW